MKPFLYEHLIKSLLLELASGAYEAGDRFLSRHQIEKLWQVSKPTVAKALRYLTTQELLSSRTRSAFRVTDQGVGRARILLNSAASKGLPPPDTWNNRRNRLGRDPRTEGLRLGVIIERKSPRLKDIQSLLSTHKPTDIRKKMDELWMFIGFQREANRFFCQTEFFVCEGDSPSIRRVVKELSERRIDGVAVFRRWRFEPKKPLFRALKANGFPVVAVDQDCEGIADASINFNDELMGYEAMRILVAKGHRRILLVTGPAQQLNPEHRLQGALVYLRENKFQTQVRAEVVRWNPSQDNASNLTLLARCFDRPTNRPTALFCPLMIYFERLKPLLLDRAITMPRDLSVIGCGSMAWKNSPSGGIDMFGMDYAELGRTAATQLLNLTGGQPIDRTCQIEAPYLRRRSVGRPRVVRPTTKST